MHFSAFILSLVLCSLIRLNNYFFEIKKGLFSPF